MNFSAQVFSHSELVRPLFINSRKTLILLSAIGIALVLNGCGGSGPSTPVTPVTSGSVAFATPTDGSTISSLPTTVTLNLLNGASLTNVKVTLDGEDITSRFAASGTTATATLSAGIYLGNNRLVATISSNTAKAGFIYDPSGTPAGGLPPGAQGVQPYRM